MYFHKLTEQSIPRPKPINLRAANARNRFQNLHNLGPRPKFLILCLKPVRVQHQRLQPKIAQQRHSICIGQPLDRIAHGKLMGPGKRAKTIVDRPPVKRAIIHIEIFPMAIRNAAVAIHGIGLLHRTLERRQLNNAAINILSGQIGINRGRILRAIIRLRLCRQILRRKQAHPDRQRDKVPHRPYATGVRQTRRHPMPSQCRQCRQCQQSHIAKTSRRTHTLQTGHDIVQKQIGTRNIRQMPQTDNNRPQ